ncbi:MAG: hypothetical protein ACLGXA_08025 [Acidobacteriota bacterium]
MKRLITLLALAAPLLAQDTEGIPADLTIAHLNRIIEYQDLKLNSCTAQLADMQKSPALVNEISGNIKKMQQACAAHDATLAMLPNGLYAPDENGMPHCKPNPPKAPKPDAH